MVAQQMLSLQFLTSRNHIAVTIHKFDTLYVGGVPLRKEIVHLSYGAVPYWSDEMVLIISAYVAKRDMHTDDALTEWDKKNWSKLNQIYCDLEVCLLISCDKIFLKEAALIDW